ncbi:MAG: DUF3530 family protein [Cellvibrionaceae bacterium]
MNRYKYYAIFLFTLSLFNVNSWAQDNTETKEPDTAATESSEESEQVADEEPAAQQKPVRLSGNTPRARKPTSEDESMKILADYLPQESLLWLENRDERFLSIWQKDRSGDPKGALLIVHAEGEHPAWPNTTKPLHDTLPDYGWATLAISLPTPDLPKVPDRTLPTKVKLVVKTKVDDTQESNEETPEEGKEAAKNSETKKAPQVAQRPPPKMEKSVSAELRSEKRLEAALRFLHDQGQFNLIIMGNGSGAIRAHDFLDKITPKISNPKLKESFEKPVRAMVILNGRNQLPTMKNNYGGWFSDPEIPVLDIFIETDYRNSADAKKRKVLARQKKVDIYKQVRITETFGEKSWGENQLSRRVRSFLDTNAVGIEVKNAKLRTYK